MLSNQSRFRHRVSRHILFAVAAAAAIAIACGGATAASPEPTPAPPPKPTSGDPADGLAAPAVTPDLGSALETIGPVPTPTIVVEGDFTLREQEFVNGYRLRDWKTNFAKRLVPIDEFQFAGLERDAIRPIDDPVFRAVSDAPAYMRPFEPVVSLVVDGEARAYPLAILMWHEIVNDIVGGIPVATTFCPLCNTAIAFDRRIDGQTLRFGTTGTLRNSDLVMWDDRTQSWWQQITGEAMVGDMAGKKLELLNAPIVGWGSFAEKYPDGVLMERPAGTGINYDLPPYAGYDDVRTPPWFYDGPLDERLPGTERVVTLDIDGVRVAYPFSALRNESVINDRVGQTDVLILFEPRTESAFIPDYSRDPGDPDLTGSNLPVGSFTTYDRHVNDLVLTFSMEDEVVVDQETGSTWDFFGQAVEGPLAGTQLRPLRHGTHFWFAWAVFFPDTEVRLPRQS